MNSILQKDKTEAQRVIASLAEDGATDYEVIQTELHFLKQRAEHVEINNYQLAGIFHRLSLYFTEKAIAERLLDDNPSEMIRRLRLSARFAYLNALANSDEYAGGDDCLHIFGLTKALAVQDRRTINAFLNNFPASVSQGEPAVVLLCNAIYSVVGRSEDTASIQDALQSQGESGFYRALFDCLNGIISASEVVFSGGMVDLLVGNRKHELHSSMQKVICLEAHAMYYLLEKYSSLASASFKQPTRFPWDAELQRELMKKNSTPIDISRNSRVLNDWLNNLPREIQASELVAELTPKKHSFFRWLKRLKLSRDK